MGLSNETRFGGTRPYLSGDIGARAELCRACRCSRMVALQKAGQESPDLFQRYQGSRYCRA